LRLTLGTFGVFSAIFGFSVEQTDKLRFGAACGVDTGTLELDFKLSKSSSTSCFFGFGEVFFSGSTGLGSNSAEKFSGFLTNDSMSMTMIEQILRLSFRFHLVTELFERPQRLFVNPSGVV
jgi:hypothetical protein